MTADRRTKAELLRDCRHAEQRATVLERVLYYEAYAEPVRAYEFAQIGDTADVVLLEARLYGLTEANGGYIVLRVSNSLPSSTAFPADSRLYADLINNWLPTTRAGGGTVAYNEALKRLARSVTSIRDEAVNHEKSTASSAAVRS